MAIKINIRKMLSGAVWSVVGAGVLVLLVAAIRYRNNNICKGYRINVSGAFIGKKDIAALLAPPTASSPERPIQSYDLRRLETTLEKNSWVRKARLFFDNNNVLHVDVTGRTPVTRIFTEDGNSFYLDSEGVRLPLVTQLKARLPVFTGYPSGRNGRQPPDSLLKAAILRISAAIRQDSFWMAQIAQIDITPDRTFELEPEIGDHRIAFGDGNDAAQKFHRLFLFYRQVLSRIGFEKYARIDVSYDGQIVATKKGGVGNRYDSLQGMNNIRQLIRSAQQLSLDSVRRQPVRPLESNPVTEPNLATYDLLPGAGDSSAEAARPRATHQPTANGKKIKNN